VPWLETALGHPQLGLGLDLSVITPELTHALTVPAFAELLPLHQVSMADSREQARKLAETFQTPFEGAGDPGGGRLSR
jgi:FMN-dependent NADH-azoreductase